MLFYSACGKPTPYVTREEQINNAYWLVSLMMGINMSSLLFVVNFLLPIKELSRLFFFLLFFDSIHFEPLLFPQIG